MATKKMRAKRKTAAPAFPPLPLLVHHFDFPNSRSEWDGTAEPGPATRAAHLLESTKRISFGDVGNVSEHHPRHARALALFLAALGEGRGEEIEKCTAELVQRFSIDATALDHARNVARVFLDACEGPTEDLERIGLHAGQPDMTTHKQRQVAKAEMWFEEVKKAKIAPPARYVHVLKDGIGFVGKPVRVSDEQALEIVCRQAAREVVSAVLACPADASKVGTERAKGQGQSKNPDQAKMEAELSHRKEEAIRRPSAYADSAATEFEVLKEMAIRALADDFRRFAKNRNGGSIVAECRIRLGIDLDDKSKSQTADALRTAKTRATSIGKRR